MLVHYVTVEIRMISWLQVACHEESDKIERAFILQLLGVDGSNSGKEVIVCFIS